MNSARIGVLLVCAYVLCPGCGWDYAKCPDPVDGAYEAPNGAGTLIVQNGVRVLKLHGSNYEMGHAYGYLLAREIVFMVDNVILPAMQMPNRYERVRDSMALVDWENAYGQELEGMLVGIQDRLESGEQFIHPFMWRKGRPLDLVDLQLANSISDWLCSSFSVWGQGRADGSTLYARNLDYIQGRDQAFQRAQVIISYDDDNDTRARWATASVSGLAGCITGMNEHGMTLALHDTDFFPTSDTAGFIPRCMMARRLMEQAGPASTPADLELLLEEIPDYFGTNLHATFPAAGRTDNETAGVLEFDGFATHADGRATLRSPSENPGLPVYGTYDHSLEDTSALINTNHYVKRREDASGSANNSGDRYLTIKDMLGAARSDDNVTAEEARGIMAAVGSTGTMHTVIFEPDARLLRFYLSQPGKGGFDCPPRVYQFEELF